jgi:hypothetical protein
MKNHCHIQDIIFADEADLFWKDSATPNLITRLHKSIDAIPAKYRKSAKIVLCSKTYPVENIQVPGLAVTYKSPEPKELDFPNPQRYLLDKKPEM